MSEVPLEVVLPMHEAPRIRRRTVLASVAVPALAGAASTDLDVQPLAGGFTVHHAGNLIWAVTRATIATAFGDDAAATVSGPLNAPVITCAGRLLDAPLVLRIAFERGATAWMVEGSITVAAVPLAGFARAPVPLAETLPLQLQGGVTSAGVPLLSSLFPVQVSIAGSRLGVGRDLIPALDLSTGIRAWPGLPRVMAWHLLPGAGDVSLLARSAALASPSLAVEVAEHAGRSISLAGAADAVWLGRTPELSTAALVTGDLRLEVGETTLPVAKPDGRAERAAFGRTAAGRRAADLRLRFKAKDCLIDTPGGAFVVAGMEAGPPDIRIATLGQALQTFEVSAFLRHSAIRLPLRPGQPGHADLGRLDFEGDQRLAFRLGTLPAPAAAGAVQLGALAGPSVELSLNRARLTVRRQRDLLSLVFGFDGVALVAGAGSPVLRLPDGADQACPQPDRPPLLRVEFPPQHVLEHAYARRRPRIPIPIMSFLPDEVRRRARDPGQRAGLFEELIAEEKTEQERTNQASAFLAFVPRYEEAFARLVREAPKDHPDRFWFTEEFAFTPQARQAARQAVSGAQSAPPLAEIPLGLGRIVVTDLVEAHPPRDAASALALLQDLLREAERRDDDHVIIQDAWRRMAGAPGGRSHERFYDKAAWGPDEAKEPRTPSPWEAEFNDPEILQALRDMWRLVPDFTPANARAEVEAALRRAYEEPFPWGAPVLEGTPGKDCADPDHWSKPVEARAAGVTHLVFEWTCRSAAKGGPPTIPYALSSLLDWTELRLRVSRRAERFEPRTPAGLAEALNRQEIRPGGDVRTRLAQVAVAALGDGDAVPQTPGFPLRTRLAMPARLHLSPAGDAAFCHTPDPTEPGPAPLWRTELREAEGRAPTLRALGSPDFVPGALGLGVAAPVRGPGDSWIGEAGGRFRGALDASDRHQIVGLSGVHGLPVIPRRGQDGKLHLSQVAPPPRYELQDLLPADVREQALYVSQTLPARLMTLSAMGATLDLDARFTPPAALRDKSGRNLFDAFAVERWRSRIVLGREIVTELLYKGFLYPLGHRATLVKVTERRFEPAPKDVCGGPVAYLSQRLFIQVASPTKTYGAVGQPFGGRGWPARSIEVVTRQTPDLIEPFLRGPGAEPKYAEHPRGTLRRQGGVGLVFWPRTGLGRENDVRFRMRVDAAPDIVELPLLFMDNQAAHEPDEMQRVREYYNETVTTNDARRRLAHHGATRRYAPERRPGDTTFETREWVLRGDSRAAETAHDAPSEVPADPATAAAARPLHSVDSALESDDQPPFYPRLQEAAIRHGPAARFSGQDPGELIVTYPERYLLDGFPLGDEGAARRAGGVELDSFLRVLWPEKPVLRFGNAGDRGGALGRPEQPILALARIGPVGNTPAAGGTPSLASFFVVDADKGDEAKLLGLLSFKKLLEVTGATMAAPLLREVTEFACNDDVQAALRALADILAGLDAQFANREVLAQAYPALRKASGESLRDVSAVAACPTANLASAVAAAVASLRTLSAELERAAAAPLAPLTDIARRRLEEQRSKLVNALRTLATPALPLSTIIDAVKAGRAFLQPVDDTWLLARYIGTEAERAALDGVASRIRLALAGAFTETAGQIPLPATLKALRNGIAEAASTRLTDLADANTGLVRTALRKLAGQAPEVIRGVQLPAAVAELYDLAAALARSDLDVAARALTQRARAELDRWSGTVAPDLCEKAGAILAPLAPVLARAGLGALVPCGTSATACVAPGTSGWCARLWSATCELGGTVPAATDSLLLRLRTLDGAGVAFVAALPAAGSCDTEAATTEWQNLLDAWSSVGPELQRWVEAVAKRAAELRALAQAGLTARVEARLRELASLARELLRILVPADTLLQPVETALNDAFGAEAAAALLAEVAAARTSLQAALDALPAGPTDAAAALTAAADALKSLPEQVRALQEGLLARVLLARLAAVGKPKLEAAGRTALRAVVDAYDAFLDIRDQAATTLAGIDPGLAGTGAGSLACAVFLGENFPGPCVPGARDEVVAARDTLNVQAAGNEPVPSALDLLADWRARKTAPQRLLDAVLGSLAAAAVAQLVQLLDLGNIRRQIEERLAQLVPTSIRRSYDYQLPMEKNYPVGSIFNFRPDAAEPALTLRAEALVNIRGDAELSIDAKLSPFFIDLQDYFSLRFNEFTFQAGTGRSARFEAPFDRIELSGKLVFLAALAAYLGYRSAGTAKDKPNGPYIEPRGTGAGLRAGFRLAVPGFNIGTVGFANIAFDGHVELPFDRGRGVARLALSSRPAPFVISSAPYGGSGFVYIEADGEGTRRMDVCLEFGGAATVQYGPLDGVGRVMTGLYVTQVSEQHPRLFGTFTAAFVGSVAGFGVASGFYLRMTYESGQMAGDAILSYSFSLGITDIRINITVWRSEGANLGSDGGPRPADGQTEAPPPPSSPIIPAAFQPAQAQLQTLDQASARATAPPLGIGRTDVPSPLQDWSAHRRLYDTALAPRPRRADA